MLLSESAKAKIELMTGADRCVVKISGIIDEDLNLGVVLNALSGMNPPPARLVFDLGLVKRLNSCGVREWILLLKKIPETIQCVFENVSVEVIGQANPIPDVLGRGKGIVDSFEAPYFCEKCQKTLLKMLKPGQITMSGSQPIPPEQHCETCASTLKFDEVEQEYFYFLRWAGGKRS